MLDGVVDALMRAVLDGMSMVVCMYERSQHPRTADYDRLINGVVLYCVFECMSVCEEDEHH